MLISYDGIAQAIFYASISRLIWVLLYENSWEIDHVQLLLFRNQKVSDKFDPWAAALTWSYGTQTINHLTRWWLQCITAGDRLFMICLVMSHLGLKYNRVTYVYCQVVVVSRARGVGTRLLVQWGTWAGLGQLWRRFLQLLLQLFASKPRC